MKENQSHTAPTEGRQEMPSLHEEWMCRRALNRRLVPEPDVDRQWQHFCRQNDLSALQRPHSKRRVWKVVWGFTAGMAAMLAIGLFIGRWMESDRAGQVRLFSAITHADDVCLTSAMGVTHIVSGRVADSTLLVRGIRANTDSLRCSAEQVVAADPQWMTLVTPRGKDYHVTLADGTRVWLNAGSRLDFPERFVGKLRTVRLQGEGYFEVAPDKAHPFCVENECFVTTALGTEFNLRAYSPADAHVVLVEGKVALSVSPNAEPYLLQPGHKAQWTDGGFTVSPVDTYCYVQWKEGYFYFNNVPLQEILQEMGRWYNVDIYFEEPQLMATRLHFVADRKQQLAETLEHLNMLKVAHAELRDGKVSVKRTKH